jgi:hypothetical protein
VKGSYFSGAPAGGSVLSRSVVGGSVEGVVVGSVEGEAGLVVVAGAALGFPGANRVPATGGALDVWLGEEAGAAATGSGIVLFHHLEEHVGEVKHEVGEHRVTAGALAFVESTAQRLTGEGLGEDVRGFELAPEPKAAGVGGAKVAQALDALTLEARRGLLSAPDVLDAGGVVLGH